MRGHTVQGDRGRLRKQSSALTKPQLGNNLHWLRRATFLYQSPASLTQSTGIQHSPVSQCWVDKSLQGFMKNKDSSYGLQCCLKPGLEGDFSPTVSAKGAMHSVILREHSFTVHTLMFTPNPDVTSNYLLCLLCLSSNCLPTSCKAKQSKFYLYGAFHSRGDSMCFTLKNQNPHTQKRIHICSKYIYTKVWTHFLNQVNGKVWLVLYITHIYYTYTYCTHTVYI